MDYQVNDDGDPRKYWTQTPNIVYDLGLTPYESTLYAHIKRAAGAGGRCTKSTRTLAQETGMSLTMVGKAKAGLCKPRAELRNKPLIRVTEGRIRTGGKASHIIKVTDIWRENHERFASKEDREQVPYMDLSPSLEDPQKGVARSKTPISEDPYMDHKKNIDQEKQEEHSLRAREEQIKPRAPESDDAIDEAQPKVHYNEILKPSAFGYDVIAVMHQMFPGLQIDGKNGLYEQWAKSRIVNRGVGRPVRPKSTPREYALDLENYLRKCETNQQNRTNGNGAIKAQVESRFIAGPMSKEEMEERMNFGKN